MSVIEAETSEAEAAARPQSLSHNADQRRRLRRQADRAELRLALRDLAEALRGFIRAAPLTAVATAGFAGAILARKPRVAHKPRVARKPRRPA